MPKNKRKRKVVPDAAPPVPEAAPPVQDATPPEADAPPAALHAPRPAVDKPCRACTVALPARARFCSVCGEPQVQGLERPPYRFPPAAADPAARAPVQAPLPSVPRVAVPRSAGASWVPTLTADRPIPPSLLQPQLAGQASARVDAQVDAQVDAKADAPADAQPDAPVLQAATAAATTLEPSPQGRVEPVVALEAVEAPLVMAAHPPAEPPSIRKEASSPASLEQEQPSAAANQPLFDTPTETRILALRSSHELTLERFERLMVGFRLKPKPKVKAAPAKSAEKSKGKADAKADKKSDKKAKGH